MNSQERVLETLDFRKADRVPIYDIYWPEFVELWRENKKMPENTGIDDYYHNDVEVVIPQEQPFPSLAGLLREDDVWQISRNAWGATKRTRKDAKFSETLDVALPDKSKLDRLEFESPLLDSRFPDPAMVEELKTSRCVFVKTGGPFLRTANLRGEEEWLIDLAADPEFALELAMKATRHITAVYIANIPWGEFERGIPELQLRCGDLQCRDIENVLRRRIFTANRLSCDVAVDGEWVVSKVIENDDWGVPQVDAERIASITGSAIAAQSFTPIIADEADIGKIRWPEVRHNREETARRLAFAEYLFKDILPVRACGVRHLFFKAWDWIVRRTGVANALMDMAARQDFMHALIDRLTQTALARIEQLEKNNCVTPARCPVSSR